MRQPVLRLTVAALAVALLAACGTSDASTGQVATREVTPLAELTPLDDPQSHQGPSTAVLADRSLEVLVQSPDQTLPTTVVSHDQSGKREVTVEDTSRVLALSLSGTLASTVYGLGFGDTLVGRDVSTQVPDLKDLPVVSSDGHAINAETVMSLRPSLVITDGSLGPRDVIEQLRDAGVAVVFVDQGASFEGAVQLAHDVAAIYGAPEAGEKLAAHVGAQIEATEAEIERFIPDDPDDRLSMLFLYLRGGSGVYYLFGQESGASDLIEGLGGIDLATELGWKDSRPLTDEAVIKANPDLILVMSGGLESVNGVDGLLESKPAIAMTKAGENRRFVDMADGDILSFGPRSAAILEALARAVYAPNS